MNKKLTQNSFFNPQRRSFLRSLRIYSLWGGIVSLSLFTTWKVFISALFDSNRFPKKWNIGSLDEIFATGNTQTMMIDNVPIILMSNAGTVQCFDLRCTHAQCVVHYNQESQLFHCPCHGGEFFKDGKVRTKPPQKPLRTIQSTVKGNIVYLYI